MKKLLAAKTFLVFRFFTLFTMPSHGVYFSDDEYLHVERAALISPEKKPSPYIAEAVRQRMARDGFTPENPLAEVMALVQELGPEESLDALAERARIKARQEVTA